MPAKAPIIAPGRFKGYRGSQKPFRRRRNQFNGLLTGSRRFLSRPQNQFSTGRIISAGVFYEKIDRLAHAQGDIQQETEARYELS